MAIGDLTANERNKEDVWGEDSYGAVTIVENIETPFGDQTWGTQGYPQATERDMVIFDKAPNNDVTN